MTVDKDVICFLVMIFLLLVIAIDDAIIDEWREKNGLNDREDD